TRLLRRHADKGEPCVDELRPGGYGELSAAEAEGVASFGVEVELGGDAGVAKRDVVRERIVDVVDVIVFVLEKEGWRCVARDMKVGTEHEIGDSMRRIVWRRHERLVFAEPGV